MQRSPQAFNRKTNLSNRRCTAAVRGSVSRNSQTLLAPGTTSCSASRAKRMNDPWVALLIVGLDFEPPVWRLQHLDFDHQYIVIERPAAPRPVRAGTVASRLAPNNSESTNASSPLARRRSATAVEASDLRRKIVP